MTGTLIRALGLWKIMIRFEEIIINSISFHMTGMRIVRREIWFC